MVDDVGFALADAGIIERPVDFVGLGDDPLAVLEVTPLLGDLADVDFGVEIGGESHPVVTGVAIDDVEVMDFVEMMLGGIGGEDGRDARVETAAEDSGEPGSLEPVLISPLPRILEMRLVIGRIEVIAPALEAGIHDGEVLVRQGDVDDDVGLERPEQFAQLGDAVGVDLRGLDPSPADGGGHGVAFGFGAAGEHHVGEDGIGGDLLRDDRPDTPRADNQGFTHKRYDL